MQVYPEVPPQVASGDVTRLLGVAVAAALLAVDDAATLEELPVLLEEVPQVPKTL